MPAHLQNAIGSVGGAYRVNKQNLGDIVKLLSMSIQKAIQYPGADKTIRVDRKVNLTEDLQMTILTNICFRHPNVCASGFMSNVGTGAVFCNSQFHCNIFQRRSEVAANTISFVCVASWWNRWRVLHA